MIKREIIDSTILLHGLDDRDKELLSENLEIQKFKRGEFIFRHMD